MTDNKFWRVPKKYQERVFEEFKELEKQKGKRNLGTRAKEARMLHRLGGSRAVKHWSGAQDSRSIESCSSSMACDMEEVGSESSRKMRDKEGTTSEASWTAVTQAKEKRCGGWNRRAKRKSLEPQPRGAG